MTTLYNLNYVILFLTKERDSYESILVMAVYNGEKYLIEQLDSIRKQRIQLMK